MSAALQLSSMAVVSSLFQQQLSPAHCRSSSVICYALILDQVNTKVITCHCCAQFKPLTLAEG